MSSRDSGNKHVRLSFFVGPGLEGELGAVLRTQLYILDLREIYAFDRA
jgi:hypothetical protein